MICEGWNSFFEHSSFMDFWLGVSIKDGSIFKIKPVAQDRSKEVRYSKKDEFNEKIVQMYFKKNINLNKNKFNNSLLKEPFFLN